MLMVSWKVEVRMPINEWSDNILIAELIDDPAFSDDTSLLIQKLEAATELPDVIVDMKGVTFISSSNIAQLLRIRKKLASDEARLRICSVDESVWSVLVLTGLEQLFSFTDDVATSLASLQIESPQE